jgi:Uma2 family endonuclease
MNAIPIVVGPLPKPIVRRVSFEAYYEAEQKAETRSEWIDGVVRPIGDPYGSEMAGASENHITVVANLGEFRTPLKRMGSCRLLGNDTQIPIQAHDLYTYPDGVVACPPRFAARPRGALLNPKTIFEVLSSSTEAYDRGDKFRYYRSLDTFEEYVLVSTRGPRVEVFFRDRDWGVQTYEGLDAVARLESVGLDLPLRELYADVEFEDA